MAENERLFILKTETGEEYGPADQETLIRWAEAGRVTYNCQIRSTLIPRWERACNVAFLKEMLMAQLREEEEAKVTAWDRIKRRATMRAPEEEANSSLKKTRPESYESAPLGLRILAAIVDIVVLLALAIFIYLFFALLFSAKLIDPNIAFYLGWLLFQFLFFFYYAYTMVIRGQTIGQKMFGIILMKKKGGQFWCGRAFFYALGLLAFGPLTLFAPLFGKGKRSPQEFFTSTRMVRILLTSKKY